MNENVNLASLISLKQYQEDILYETEQSLLKYGEGAISLFPGGGKSFIAARIACSHLLKYQGMGVLWMGPLSANNNVYSSVVSKLPMEFKKRIHFKSYESMSHGIPDIDIKYDEICLIVLDESHKALANIAYTHVSKILNSCKCDRLAMSATRRRTDGRDSFKVLVPSAVYTDYDFKQGAEQEILNEINYRVCSTRISKFDFETYNEYKKLGLVFEGIKDECNKIDNLLSEYSFKFEYDTYRIMRDSGMDLSGSNGDRHIMFFSTVEGLRQHKEAAEGIFNRLYPNCKVRVYEYHSLQSKKESKEVLDNAVNSVPRPYTVDVILSVNKGTESIHPRHIKSVSMFRQTASQIVFIQQMGRGVTLKEFSDRPTYIFDFSGGYVSLLRGTSIEYGRRMVSDRVQNIKSIASIDELVHSLRKALSSNINIKAEFATEELKELSDRMNNLYSSSVAKQNLLFLAQLVKALMKNYKTDIKEMPSIYNLENLAAGAILKSELVPFGPMNQLGTLDNNFIEWFNATTYALLNNRIEKDSDEYNKISKFGHLFYLNTKYCKVGPLEEDHKYMCYIDSIRATLDSMDNDYSKLKNKVANKKLLELRRLNIFNRLSVPVCKYARDKNVDISMDRLNFSDIKKITPEDEYESFKAYYEEAKLGKLILLNISNGIDTDEITNNTYNMWIVLMAKHGINSILFNSTYSNFLRHKIEILYSKAFKFDSITSNDEEEGKRIISLLMRYRNGKQLTNLYQEYVFEHYGLRGLSDYCKAIFREFGIKSKAQYADIIKSTKWDKEFNSALGGDENAMVELLRTNVAELDPFRRKLLNSFKFKEAKRQLKDDTTPVLILKKAREFYGADTDRQQEISLAIKNGIVSGLDIATAPFSESIRDSVADLIKSKLSLSDWIHNNRKEWSVIKKTCTSSVSCTSMILPNIMGIKHLDKNMKQKLQEIYEVIFNN